MPLLSPPFMPNFGNGAPGANVPRNQPYFDVSTAPYTPYVYNNGWKTYGGGASSNGNATSLQGVPIDPVAPNNGDALIYDAGTGKYIPGPASLSAPTIVQSNAVAQANCSLGIVMPSIPTQGNLLLAICTPSTTTAGAGWSSLYTATAFTGALLVACKVASNSETAAQFPTTGTQQGAIALWELAGYTSLGIINAHSSANQTITLTNFATNIGQLILGMSFMTSLSTPIVTGADHVYTQNDGTRSCVWYDRLAPATGFNNVLINFNTGGNVVYNANQLIAGP